MNFKLDWSLLSYRAKSFIVTKISRLLISNIPLYALLAFITSTRIKSSSNLNTNHKYSKVKLLAIFSPGAFEDLQAIARSSDTIDFEIIVVDYLFFAQLFRSVLGNLPHDYDIYYQRGHELRLRYLNQVTQFLGILKNGLFDFQAIINFNFVYYYTRDIEVASTSLNVKFITLMKECLRTSAYAKSTIGVYNKNVEPYFGDLVLVHNYQTKNILLKSGLFSCPIIVSGQPRSDLLKNCKQTRSLPSTLHSLNIVYFMISSRAGLPYFSGSYFDATPNQIKPKNWDNINQRALKCIFLFMSSNPRIF